MSFAIVLFFVLVVLLVFTQFKIEKVFASVLLISLISQQITTQQIFINATNPGLITLLLLLICSSVINKTTFISDIKRYLFKPSFRATYIRLVAFTSLFSAFFNNTAVVSLLMGIIKNNKTHPYKKLLIPLSYAAILGGTMTLIGTSTNLIVNSFLEETQQAPLALFDFFIIGATVTLICLTILYFLTNWLPVAPDKAEKLTPYFIHTKVNNNSELIHRTVNQNGLRNLDNLFLVEIIRDKQLIAPIHPEEVIEEDDLLVFSGDVKNISQLKHFKGLKFFNEETEQLSSNLVEVLISNSSRLTGKTIKESKFRSKFDAAIVAMKRDGERISDKFGNIELKSGDNLVLAIGNDFKKRNNLHQNFIFISDIKMNFLLNNYQSTFALMGFALVLILSSLFQLNLLNGLIYLLAFYLLFGLIRPEEVRNHLPLSLWVVITSALSMATLLQSAGVVDEMSQFIQSANVFSNPIQAMILLYIFTLILTETMTNNAAAALAFPLAIIFSSALGVNLKPFVMAVAMGASASFMSPFGYQTNLMVFNLGNYRKKDFIKVGSVISIVYSSIVLFLIPVVFPF